MLIGLVGRPSTGKSTFFKAATLSDVLIADYPFATIKPNHGIACVKVKDLAVEFEKHSDPREGYVKGDFRFVPFELMDVAGLVAGASEGKGLGNEFLNDLAPADAFIHIVDMSGESDGEGKPAENYYPGNDIDIIEKELDLWYTGILKKNWSTLARKIEIQKVKFSEEIAQQFSGLKVNVDDVKDALRKANLDGEKPNQWSKADLMKFSQTLRKISKPMIIAANKVDRPNGRANYEKIKEEYDYPIVSCYAEGELALREADKAGLIDYTPGDETFENKGELNEKQEEALAGVKKILTENNGTGVQQILNTTVLELLGYICIYPAGSKLVDSKGNVLPDCYLMKKGSTALDFAYRLHTDIGKNFIKAVDVRTKRVVGKEYEIKHGDGLEIMTK